MKKDFISVIIPTYNRGELIKKTIESVENCGTPKKRFEIIVVDDCSKKSPKTLIKHLSQKYKNIKYVKTRKNSGPSVARNQGVRISRGEYLFFTDDDCIVPKRWISKYIDFFKKNKEVMCVGGCAVPASDNWIAKIENIKDNLLKIRVKKAKIGGKEIPTGFTGNTAYRREVFEEFSGFDEGVRRQEDVLLKNKVAEKYLVASLPVLVIHNHNFDLKYLLSRIIKEGLDQSPPEGLFSQISLLVWKSPFLIYNVIKKTIKYRG